MSEEKKAELKACPFCNSTRIVKGERYFAMCVDCGATGPERVRENTAARIYNGDWNTRPREQEIEEELAGANKYNDTSRPLDEVMKAISESVMDFQPDIQSLSAGTLIERVQTAAECGRGEFVQAKKLAVGVAQAVAEAELQVMQHWVADDQGRAIECVCAECIRVGKVLAKLYQITAALKEGR